MHEIGIIKSYIEKVSNTPPVEQGIKDRVILYLWNLLKRKRKLTVKDRWTEVEDEYLQKMAGVLSLEEVYKKFHYRGRESVRKRIWLLGLGDEYRRKNENR